ncbi:uncharacterized protein LOC114252300, partial [Bombyx mandarina]|uniref:Uncharacterized protein LOC114252300 n=1 Tax=Bombyx mandarina TaxID=7092 RepID=A0A6J2KNR4_BOMMA
MQVVKAFDDMYYAISEASNADPGNAGASASHYISPKPFGQQSCCQRLGLPLRRCPLAVVGLGQNAVHHVTGVTSCTVLSRTSENPHFNINPIVVNTITSKMPATNLPSNLRDSFKHLVLADENFDKSSNVDLLLGAELFHSIYDGQRVQPSHDLPVALHSVFGWVITGKLNTNYLPPPTISSLLASTRSLDEGLKRFWEIEEPPNQVILNPEDIKCEQMYSNLTYRNPDGRYVVPMLLKEPISQLGDSFNQSFSRLVNLERRLDRNLELKKEYTAFMREYKLLGHMELSADSNKTGQYIIPHHCVIRPERTTTKLRVVFDASAKTTNGKSLNDLVYTGPKLQNDIGDILTKFRLHAVVFIADISKMYRNIELRPEDRKWQHILWRDSPSDPVTEYELKTVTYGVTSSPYLAIRTLHQLASDYEKEWPLAAASLRHDTFMDDITVGATSIETALKHKEELIQMLARAKFELRKWSSNSPEFLTQIPTEHCQVPKIFCDEKQKQSIKILGVQWDPADDNFTYALSELTPGNTKRAILSNVARIYDPLGCRLLQSWSYLFSLVACSTWWTGPKWIVSNSSTTWPVSEKLPYLKELAEVKSSFLCHVLLESSDDSILTQLIE